MKGRQMSEVRSQMLSILEYPTHYYRQQTYRLSSDF